MSKPDWSRDGRFIYFSATRTDGSQGLYSLPAAGGGAAAARTIRRSNEASIPLGFSVSDGKLCLTVSEFESDIYVTDLAIN